MKSPCPLCGTMTERNKLLIHLQHCGDKQRSKYNACKTLVIADGTLFKLSELMRYGLTQQEGIVFDSLAEAEYYVLLLKKISQGEIKSVKCQPSFVLQEPVSKGNKKLRSITYKADFRIEYPCGRIEIVDVKGKMTDVFRIKYKLFEKAYPELALKVIKKQGKGFVDIS